MTEAIFNTDPIRTVDGVFIEELKRRAEASPRKRFRLCMHRDAGDATQEMVICVQGGSYFRPHKHPPGRSESYHIIEGQMDVHFFDDEGRETGQVSLAAAGQARPFLYRMSDSIYHFVRPRSPWVVYHEILTGPWSPEEVVLPAPFAPDEGDEDGIARFIAGLAGPQTESGTSGGR